MDCINYYVCLLRVASFICQFSRLQLQVGRKINLQNRLKQLFQIYQVLDKHDIDLIPIFFGQAH